MSAIYKREVKTYLWSVTGWLFMAATLCLAGFYFFALNLNYGYANFANTIANILFILLLTTPVLAMRILAEERKQKTDQMILTAPVSIGGIVVGKYLAMATIFTIPVAIICLMPLVCTQYGSVPMGESYTAILAYYLFGLACLAISLFVSSLTESQVIAAVLSFALLFIGYMMDNIISFVSSGENILTKILGLYSFYPRLSGMLGGTLNLTSVLYFITLIAVFLFLTTQSIQKRRYQVSVKTFQMGAYSTAATVIVVAIAVFVNMAAGMLPSTYTTIDVSDMKLYSLTDTTKNVLNALEDDVTIYVIRDEESQDSVLGETLKRYAEMSDHIKVEYKDPIVYPNFYKEYTENITINSMIVESDKRFKVVNYSDIYEYSYDYYTYEGTATGYDGEGELTSAIAYVTGDNAPKIYEINGHNETELSAAFKDGVKKENIDLSELTLLTSENVPEDADAVVLNAPVEDINAEDAQKLIAYLENGGKVIVTTSYTENFSEAMPNLSSVLAYFGLTVGDGLIVENDQTHMYQSPLYLMPEVKASNMTTGIYGADYNIIMFPYAQPLHIEEREDVSVTKLLLSSESAYEKSNIDEQDSMEKNDTDPVGPFTVGAHAKKEIDEEKTAELTVYTSAFVFTDTANQYTMNNNLKLFTNAASAFSGETESVSVPVKTYSEEYLTVSIGDALLYGAVFAVIVPLGMLIFGIVIWYRRRKR